MGDRSDLDNHKDTRMQMYYDLLRNLYLLGKYSYK